MGLPRRTGRADCTKFTKDQLEKGLKLIFETDRDLRSARPDDRTVVENFVIRLCA